MQIFSVMPAVSIFSDAALALQAVKDADFETAKAFVLSLPYMYKEWWLELYRENPEHIFVETALVFFVLWLLFVRRTVDPVKTSDVDRFTDKEVAWLVDTWEPEPLVPDEATVRDERRAHGSKMVRVL